MNRKVGSLFLPRNWLFSCIFLLPSLVSIANTTSRDVRLFPGPRALENAPASTINFDLLSFSLVQSRIKHDLHSEKGATSPLKILLSTGDRLKLFEPNSSRAVSLISGLHHAVSIDFYFKSSQQGLVFWSDSQKHHSTIYRAQLQDNVISDVVKIVEHGIGSVQGLAIDSVGKKLYWTDIENGRIEITSFDGKLRSNFIDEDCKPRSLAIDPFERLIFWTDWHVQSQPRIRRALLNGRGKETVVNVSSLPEAGFPSCITLDYYTKRILWADTGSGTFHSTSYEGTNHRILHTSSDIVQVYGLEIFGTSIYWTDNHYNILGCVNLDYGEEEILLVGHPAMFGIKILHQNFSSDDQSSQSNDCGKECSECLIGPNGTSSCHCAYGKMLDEDGKSCVDQPFTLYVTQDSMLNVVERITASNKWVYPPFQLERVSKHSDDIIFAFDPFNKMIYYGEQNLVRRQAVSGTLSETVLNLCDRHLKSIAVDSVGRNLYTLSSHSNLSSVLGHATSFLSVSTLNGEFIVDLFTFKGNSEIPETVGVDSVNRILFLCFSINSTNHHGMTARIDEAELDGTNRKMLLSLYKCPRYLSTSSKTKRLCWAEENPPNMACVPYGMTSFERILSPNSSSFITAFSTDLQLFITSDNWAYNFNLYPAKKLNVLGGNLQPVVFVASSVLPDFKSNISQCQHSCKTLCIPLKSGSVCKPLIGRSSFLTFLHDGIPSFSQESEDEFVSYVYGEQNQFPVSLFTSTSDDRMDVNACTGDIYFSKAHQGIGMSRLDGKNQKIVIELKAAVSALAVDWLADNLYWSTRENPHIHVSRLDGRYPLVILNGNLEQMITAMAVHPLKGFLFWSSLKDSSRIKRSTLSGHKHIIIVNSLPGSVSDLAVDWKENLLYWCNVVSGSIERSDLSGHGRESLLKVQDSVLPISLTLSDNYIYWMERTKIGGSLKAAKKFDPNVSGTLLTGLSPNVGSIRIFNEQIQRGLNNCSLKNGGCEQLCFFEGHGMYSCACAFSKLAADGRTCEGHSEYLVLANRNVLQAVALDDPLDLNPPINDIHPSESINNIVDVVFDSKNRKFIFSDLHSPPGIFSIYVNGTGLEAVLDDDLIRHVEGIAIDSVHDDLYWTDSVFPSVCRVGVESEHSQQKPRKMKCIVILGVDDRPRGIVVDPCQLYVFWTNWATEHPTIERCSLDGADRKIVISTDLGRPNGLSVDYAELRIYWSDARFDGSYRIESCDYEGSSRQEIMSGTQHHPFAVAIYGTSIFWTDWETGSLMHGSKLEENSSLSLVRSKLERPTGLALVSLHSTLQCSPKLEVIQVHDRCLGFCLNGGTCIPGMQGHDVPECRCGKHFTGLRCEVSEASSLDEKKFLPGGFTLISGSLAAVGSVLLIVLAFALLHFRFFLRSRWLIIRKNALEGDIWQSITTRGIRNSGPMIAENFEEDHSMINPLYEAHHQEHSDCWHFNPSKEKRSEATPLTSLDVDLEHHRDNQQHSFLKP